MNKTQKMLGLSLVLVLVLGLVTTASASDGALSANGSRHSETTWERVSWWWEAESLTGISRLTRHDASLSASFVATGLTPGDAVTLWYIVFNNPAACATSPCSIPQDVFNEDAQADFHWGDGEVVGRRGVVWLRGTLEVGDVSYSGKAETGLAEPVALSAPKDAEVVLALHSHGPALSGAALEAQLTSYTGGCSVFNGADGFATGPEDLPDENGECSTVQGSLHTAR